MRLIETTPTKSYGEANTRFVSAKSITTLKCIPKKSVEGCGKCQHSDQCIEPYYCCPFHRKCLLKTRARCKETGAECSPPCHDDDPQKLCSCKDKDFPNNWTGPTCRSNAWVLRRRHYKKKNAFKTMETFEKPLDFSFF